MEKAGTNEDMAVFLNAKTPKDGIYYYPSSSNLWVYERHMSKKHLLMDSEGRLQYKISNDIL